MGILSRVIRLCKADLHGVMDQFEDKALLLKQYLREMQSAIAAQKARIDKLEETIRTAQCDLAGYGRQVKVLDEDVDRAVARCEDDIARMLIRKRHPLQQCAAKVENEVHHLTAELAAERERLAGQAMTCGVLRLRVAAVQERYRNGASTSPIGAANVPGQPEPSKEEIEWELLQRKEALASGRAK